MLPVIQKAQRSIPSKLFLFSHTKVGKTTLASALPNALIIDTENGSDFVDGIKYNLVKESKKSNKGQYTLLKKLANEIIEANAKIDGYVYDYIVFDTLSGLEEIAHKLATFLYKKSVIGKDFKGDDIVRELPQGGGYLWLREAFSRLYKMFDGISKYGMVLFGHVKLGSINIEGKELQIRDVMLTGKLKYMITQDSDAIGYLYRSKDNINQVYVTFKTYELDLATGSRSPHLRNQEFVLSELMSDGNFKFYWDKIYL